MVALGGQPVDGSTNPAEPTEVGPGLWTTDLGVQAQPRALLAKVAGTRLAELPGAETCCGFGGTFCVKYPEISDKMVGEKAADILATGADTLLAGDLGCLMNMAGKLQREGSAVRVRHVAEVLAGMGDLPPIGEPG